MSEKKRNKSKSQESNDRDEIKELIRRWFTAREARALKDIMTRETRLYGDKWLKELENIAQERAIRGIFPKEYRISNTEEELEKHHNEIVDKIYGEYTHKQGEQKSHDPIKPVVVLLSGGGAAGKTTFALHLIKHLVDRGIHKVELEMTDDVGGGNLLVDYVDVNALFTEEPSVEGAETGSSP